MNLKVINSNSKGNCYILGNGTNAILIECGVPFVRIKEALSFNLNQIDLCVCTHEHMDHAKAFSDVINSGIPAISSPDVYKAFDVFNDFNTIEHREMICIKEWEISAFKVDHDVPTLGYVIEHPKCGKVLFVTDTYVLKYKFPMKFDHIIIEANYDQTIVDEILENKEQDYLYNRRLTSHMSFQTTLETLSKMDLSACKNIVLIHLSDGFTDEKIFKAETEERFGILTTIAAPGVEINFNLKPF